MMMKPLTQGFYNANKFAKLVRRREFMASTAEGTTGAFTCATCSCHRNFHKRKELAALSSQVQAPAVQIQEPKSKSDCYGIFCLTYDLKAE
ncbi:hypothetical protein HN51_044622 [Arachis hypogaea]